MLKQILSLMLALALLAGMVPPVTVSAEAVEEMTEETITETAESTTVPAETTEPTEMPESKEVATTPVETVVSAESNGPVEPETEESAAAEMELNLATDSDVANIIAGGILDKIDQGNGEYLYNYWTIDKEGVFEITLGAPNPGYNYYGWDSYKDSITKVILPYGVSFKDEKRYSFANYPYLKEADIAMEDIHNMMFYGCTNLEKVTLHNTVISIGMNAFSGCTSLTDVQMPDDLGVLGNGAFSGCTSLGEIVLPDSVLLMGHSIFYECTNLTTARLPSNITEIPKSFFYKCEKLKAIALPQGIKTIYDSAFYSCLSLTQVVFPTDLETIGSYAFYGCEKIQNVTFPQGLKTIGDYAFSACYMAWGVVDIPASVTSIGVRAFPEAYVDQNIQISFQVSPDNEYYSSDSRGVLFNKDKTTLIRTAHPLTGVYVVPDTVKTIEEYAFYFCDGLTEVRMPDSLSYIGRFAFYSCEELEKVKIPAAVKRIYSNTFYAPLKELVLQEGLERIDAKAFIMFGRSNITTLTVPESLKTLGNNALSSMFIENVYFLGDAPTVEGYSSQYSAPFCGLGYNETYDSFPITKFYYNARNKTFTEEAKRKLTFEESIWIPIEDGLTLTLLDYVDNSAITLNACGSAFAYYTTEPVLEEGQTVYFTLDGVEGSALINDKGIFRVPLGSFDSPGEYSVEVIVIKVDDEEVSTAESATATAMVTVTPLTFTQEWQISLDPHITGGIRKGAGVSLGPIEAEAQLGRLALNGSVGMSLTLEKEHIGAEETLRLFNDLDVAVGAEGELGPVAKAESGGADRKPKFSLFEAKAGVEANPTMAFGMEIQNFSMDEVKHKQALGLYVLDSAALVLHENIMYRQLFEHLFNTAYNNLGVTTIRGWGLGAKLYAEAGALNLKVLDKDLFSAITGSGEFSVSVENLRTSSGETENSTEYISEVSLDALSATYGPNDMIEGAGLGYDILKNRIEVTAKRTREGNSIEAAYETGSTGLSPLVFSKHTLSEYNVYTFREKALDELMLRTSDYYNFLQGDTALLTLGDIYELADVLSTSEEAIEYRSEKNDTYLYAVDLDIGAALGIELDVGAEMAYLENNSYEVSTGFAVDDEIYLTGASSDLSDYVEIITTQLPELVADAVAALREFAVTFFEEVTGTIQEGIQSIWAWIKAKVDSPKNWLISIMSPGDNSGMEMESFTISACTPRSRAALSGGVRDNGSDYTFTKAATIGRPFVVGVTDADTGEEVSDLSDEPLEFTIRYSAEDLEAAGLSTYSSIVLDGGIAMYRYSDNGNYFEYIGGINDLEAMTVTATIVKTGQYILAVDGCAPSLESVDISDFRQNPTITATIDDLTGLDMSSFEFILDGHKKVWSENIADHYDPKSGEFTYTVSECEELAEGEHTMSFTLADTTGNSETYMYSFNVDLTIPVIGEVTVTGSTNASSAVEIRAQVSDENLTGVYAVFSKLLPDGTWSADVSTPMGNMGEGLWGLDYEGDGSTVKVYVKAVDIAENSIESSTQEAHPFVESVSVTQDYLSLREAESTQLIAEVSPAELAAAIKWSVEAGGEDIVSVDENGNVAALKVGTAYVIASVSDGEVTLTDRCRIDVAEAIQLDGIQLGTTKLTTELYSTDYAQFDILLKLPQNYATASESAAASSPTDMGVAITEARFTDAAVAELFALVTLDDRTVAVVPTDKALADGKAVQGKYIGTVTVMVQGRTYISEALTLTVKKSLPKLKATVDALNNFYFFQNKEIMVTGATVTAITCDNLPEWLMLKNGTLSLTECVPAKGGSAKLTLRVETEEWAVPVETVLNVKCNYKAPNIKLAVSSVQFSADTDNSSGVELQLVSKEKNKTLVDLKVIGVFSPAGYSASNYNHEDGTFTLKAESSFQPGKINLEISFADTSETMKLPLTVKATAVSLKLSSKSVTLNSKTGDSAAISIMATPANYRVTAPKLRLEGSDKSDKLHSGELDLRYDDGNLYIITTDTTPDNAKYTLYISAGGSKEQALKISTTNARSTLKLKTAGNLDLSFPENRIALTTTFKNHSGGNIRAIDHSVTETKGKNVLNEDVKAFSLMKEGSTLYLSIRDGSAIDVKNTYTLNLTLTLEDGSLLTSSIKIPIKQTAVTLKLSANKLTLNKTIADKASVTVTCNTKGYAFTRPVWQLLDSKGKESAEGKLDISWREGKLHIAVNKNTEYGTSYKLMVSAEEGAKATALTVTIPAANKSGITGTLKLTGFLDVIRDGTAITVTPTFKNCADADRIGTLTVLNGSGEDVTELFDISEQNGSYLLSRTVGAKLDHSQEYTVVLTDDFGNGVKVKASSALKLKMGSAKLMLNTNSTTLCAKDRNSRIGISFLSADNTLNKVEKVEIKDAKLREQFEIIDYGNGQYAIGFKDGKVPAKVISVNLPLEVWLEGNETIKPNASMKVKLSIVK